MDGIRKRHLIQLGTFVLILFMIGGSEQPRALNWELPIELYNGMVNRAGFLLNGATATLNNFAEQIQKQQNLGSNQLCTSSKNNEYQLKVLSDFKGLNNLTKSQVIKKIGSPFCTSDLGDIHIIKGTE